MGCDQLQEIIIKGYKQFQSTHPHGVRHKRGKYTMQGYGFNPRTHMGCDLHSRHRHKAHIHVSIHAPTWGATAQEFWRWLLIWCFNPRTHMGCDLFKHLLMIIGLSFNPRTHMGCDSFRNITFMESKSFNPRTHMGCDFHARLVALRLAPVSIHAPTWGATEWCYLSDILPTEFQSTHPHGVRLHQKV